MKAPKQRARFGAERPRDVWLDANRRARSAAGAVALSALVVGAACSVGAVLSGGWMLTLATVVAAAVVLPAFAAWVFLRRPRIAYDGRFLLLVLGRGPAARLPLDVVECFFLGTATDEASGRSTRTIVTRLAEAATQHAAGEADGRIAKWCGGYITIRGTWCEPFDADRVRLLNHLLATAKRKEQAHE